MSDKRTTGQVEIDFDRIGKIGSELNELLISKTKGSLEAYAVLRFICAYYEEDLGLEFEPQFELELRRIVRENLQACQEQGQSPPKKP